MVMKSLPQLCRMDGLLLKYHYSMLFPVCSWALYLDRHNTSIDVRKMFAMP